ncbi:DUF3291 domain-containing protein [Rhodobacterales bacterium]|nr:DUF3291 domain-containing protein [Rhodobacterales bacterium]
MSGHWLALYTFGQFRRPAEDSVNDAFFEMEPSVMSAIERSEGFVARSGYADEVGPKSWGEQVFPKYWTDNGDGWAPSTISVWTSLECALAAVYRGTHGTALRLGHLFQNEDASYPGYVLWWVSQDHLPDWAEAVARFETLGDNGPAPEAFSFKKAFDPQGRPVEVDTRSVRALAERNALRSDPPQVVQ